MWMWQLQMLNTAQMQVAVWESSGFYLNVSMWLIISIQIIPFFPLFNIVEAASAIPVVEREEIVSSQDSCATSIFRPPPAPWTNRYATFTPFLLSLFPPTPNFPILHNMSFDVSVSNVLSPRYGIKYPKIKEGKKISWHVELLKISMRI